MHLQMTRSDPPKVCVLGSLFSNKKKRGDCSLPTAALNSVGIFFRLTFLSLDKDVQIDKDVQSLLCFLPYQIVILLRKSPRTLL